MFTLPETVTAPKADREAWRRGRLHEALAARYRAVFDDDDLRLARNQYRAGSHYSEWVVAAALWDRFRLGSLVEKYEFTSQHPKKAAVLARLGIVIERRSWCQHPDLLVYDDAGNWQFVEVKSGGDVLRQTQRRLFSELETQHGRPVALVRLVEK